MRPAGTSHSGAVGDDLTGDNNCEKLHKEMTIWSMMPCRLKHELRRAHAKNPVRTASMRGVHVPSESAPLSVAVAALEPGDRHADNAANTGDHNTANTCGA